MTAPLLLNEHELRELTGYVRPSAQARWLRENLKVTPPLRADGRPVVARTVVETALAGGRAPENPAPGPNWSTP